MQSRLPDNSESMCLRRRFYEMGERLYKIAKLQIKTRNRNTRSKLEIETWKSKLEIEARNRNSKSKHEIEIEA